MKGPLRVHLSKSVLPAQLAESVNVSQRGIYFSTDSALCKGETVEVSFNMPEAVLGEPSSEWRCTGHVEPIATTGGKLGVGVQFDCYEVSRSKPADRVTGMALPQRKIAGLGSRINRQTRWDVGNSMTGFS